MQWSRIKTIILILLALVNGFLLVLVVGRESTAHRQQNDTLTSAIHVLERSGIHVEEDILPDSMELTVCSVARSRETERSMAEAFLGQTEEESLGGDVFRYVSSAGSVQFHSSGAFYASFSPGALPLGDSSPAEHAVALMEQVGETWEVVSDTTDGTVVLRQLWQGAPVYSCTAEFRYEGGELRAISNGLRLTGVPESAPAGTPLSIPTVLIQFLAHISEWGDVSSEITGLEAGYLYTSGLTGAGTLTPVWHIETDTNLYVMDAFTGDLTRTEDLGS